MKNSNERDQKKGAREQEEKNTQETATSKMDKLQQEADADTQPSKPGSQSNSSKQNNNGRGGGR